MYVVHVVGGRYNGYVCMMYMLEVGICMYDVYDVGGRV